MTRKVSQSSSSPFSLPFISSDVSSQSRNPSCIKCLKDLSASWVCGAFFSSVSLPPYLLRPLTFLFTFYSFSLPLLLMSLLHFPFFTFSLNLSLNLFLPKRKICQLTWSQNWVCVPVCVALTSFVGSWIFYPYQSAQSPPLTDTQTYIHTPTWQEKQLLMVYFPVVILCVKFVRAARKKTHRKWGSHNKRRIIG